MKLDTKLKPALLWEFYFLSIIMDLNITTLRKKFIYYGSNFNILRAKIKWIQINLKNLLLGKKNQCILLSCFIKDLKDKLPILSPDTIRHQTLGV